MHKMNNKHTHPLSTISFITLYYINDSQRSVVSFTAGNKVEVKHLVIAL
uniref:Uncharacterized protein n=1 Tax=Anguilla anguilla TaxID=7936 RepID=A0A0E9XBD4_ANGAN